MYIIYTSQLPFIWRERACVSLSNNFQVGDYSLICIYAYTLYTHIIIYVGTYVYTHTDTRKRAHTRTHTHTHITHSGPLVLRATVLTCFKTFMRGHETVCTVIVSPYGWYIYFIFILFFYILCVRGVCFLWSYITNTYNYRFPSPNIAAATRSDHPFCLRSS